MLRRLLGSVLIVGAVGLGAACGPADPTADPRASIAVARALAVARHDHKAVLLNFGADWCPDCTVLDELFAQPPVTAFLDAHFHVVNIDVGRYPEGADASRNVSLAERYGVHPEIVGIPALVVLTPDGRIVPAPTPVVWEHARTFTADEVLRYLQDLQRAAGPASPYR